MDCIDHLDSEKDYHGVDLSLSKVYKKYKTTRKAIDDPCATKLQDREV